MLYTIGYSGWTPHGILSTSRELQAIVCDIRFSPASRHPQWSRKQLSAVLGSHYTHVPALGNVNYNNGLAIQLSNYAEGKATLSTLLETWESLMLLCVCADPATCHRRVVALALERDMGQKAKDLFPSASKATSARQLTSPSGRVIPKMY